MHSINAIIFDSDLCEEKGLQYDYCRVEECILEVFYNSYFIKVPWLLIDQFSA